MVSSLPNTFSPTGESGEASSRPFQHDPDYINLKRMLVRFQHLILLTPSPSTSSGDNRSEDSLSATYANENLELLSPLQKQIQAELWSPLPFHRTKWLRNIEGARTLLLRLERVAQNIRVARVKGQISRDLAEKRTMIKKLRNRVEEIGREVEAGVTQSWDMQVLQENDGVYGESIYEILKKRSKSDTIGMNETVRQDEDLREGKPVTAISEEEKGTEQSEESARDQLLNTSTTIRRRNARDNQGADASSKSFQNQDDSTGHSTGLSGPETTERHLLDSSRTQESLTSSLVSMAAQLKQQTRAFQFSLDQDKGLLDRAIEGLDKNLTGMEAASKNMAFLKRMSEGEGWFGRLKLYALILGLWVVAILLVFVGPKLRF